MPGYCASCKIGGISDKVTNCASCGRAFHWCSQCRNGFTGDRCFICNVPLTQSSTTVSIVSTPQPKRTPPITLCKVLRSSCDVCKGEKAGGLHVRTTLYGKELEAMLLQLDKIDPGFFDNFADKTLLLFAGRDCQDKDGTQYVLFNKTVGGGTTIPSWKSKSECIEIHLWEDLVTGRSKAPFPSPGEKGAFYEEPVGILLHELWHAFLYLKQQFWHIKGAVDGPKACQAVYILSEPVRSKLSYPAMSFSGFDSEVRKALNL
jgi:hypothetical protein